MTQPVQTNTYPEERRLVTVLFADVQGFTSLAEQLDYETVSDLIKDYYRSRLDAIIEDHGGYIDKHMGDGVMAIWGAPFANEKDSENAVVAALNLVAELDKYAKISPVAGADQLKLRVGINSGQVLAGYVGTKNEYTVIGDTVNISKRLEETADANGVTIGESTYQIVKNHFRIRKLPAVLAKGKSDPINAYQVEGKHDSIQKISYDSLDKLETHMVARENEMARLKSYYENSRNSTDPIKVLITGEVGIGKSRLLLEFSHKLAEDDPAIQVISVRALAQTARVPFYIWKLIFSECFGLEENAPASRNAYKFQQEITRLWREKPSEIPADKVANTIGGLIGFMEPVEPVSANEEDIERTFQLIRALFCRLVARDATVLLIDDMQWADKESLALLTFMLKPGPERFSLLVVVGARPILLRDHPQWWGAAHIITLGPIPVGAAMVAQAYPDLKNLPQHLLVELALRAEGNPFFLEEIVKGIVKNEGGGIRLAPGDTIRQLQSQIPESLRSTLQARLDNLTREARTVALMASVVGRVFWVGPLKAVSRVNTGTGTLTSMPEAVMDRLIQDGLRQLIRAEMAFPRAGSQFSESQEYIFKNSYLRDVAYSMIPHRSRTIYHRAVARWLSEHGETAFKVMAAEHYDQAGAYFEAAEQYEQAIELARTRGAHSEVMSLTLRAKTAYEAGKKAGNNE